MDCILFVRLARSNNNQLCTVQYINQLFVGWQFWTCRHLSVWWARAWTSWRETSTITRTSWSAYLARVSTWATSGKCRLHPWLVIIYQEYINTWTYVKKKKRVSPGWQTVSSYSILTSIPNVPTVPLQLLVQWKKKKKEKKTREKLLSKRETLSKIVKLLYRSTILLLS